MSIHIGVPEQMTRRLVVAVQQVVQGQQLAQSPLESTTPPTAVQEMLAFLGQVPSAEEIAGFTLSAQGVAQLHDLLARVEHQAADSQDMAALGMYQRLSQIVLALKGVGG